MPQKQIYLHYLLPVNMPEIYEHIDSMNGIVILLTYNWHLNEFSDTFMHLNWAFYTQIIIVLIEYRRKKLCLLQREKSKFQTGRLSGLVVLVEEIVPLQAFSAMFVTVGITENVKICLKKICLSYLETRSRTFVHLAFWKMWGLATISHLRLQDCIK